MNKKRIIVAGQKGDQERNALAGIHPDWTILFAESGVEALQLAASATPEAILTEEQLPDMPGFTLLDSVMERHPETQRLMLADLADSRSAVTSARYAHQWVSKPWKLEVLREQIERSFSVAVWLSNPAARRLMSRMTVVPSPPELYFEVVRALNSPETDIDRVIERAEQDPAMTAKLLKVSNSAALGLRQEVTTVSQAISFLGLETTRSVILLAHTFSSCDKVRAAGFRIEHLWEHSLRTARMARQVARCEFAPRKMMEEAFLAGMLHDIGELLLAVNLPREYSRVLAVATEDPGRLHAEIEKEVLGVTHAEIGAELMAAWNLPLPVVEAIALHHRPTQLLGSGFRPLTAVHVADAFADEEACLIDDDYIGAIGLTDRLSKWRDACDDALAEAHG